MGTFDRNNTEMKLLAEAGKLSLVIAKRVHDELGDAGLEEVRKNQHNETALRCDVECERRVIDVFRATGLPIQVVSEEHGRFNLHTKKPRYTLVVDGLDGSHVYAQSKRTGGYGTMVAVFHGADPCYKDYLFSGVMLHALGKAYTALNGYGIQELTWDDVRHDIASLEILLPKTDKAGILQKLRQYFLTEHSIIHVDEYWAINRRTFSERLEPEHTISCLNASVMHYIGVVLKRVDFALECTRKDNIEIAVAYGLINESGGVFVDLEGRSLGEQRYLTWHQDPEDHTPVIAAANANLALDMVKYLKSRAN